MALIALITDTHWGVRNDSPEFHDYFDKFFSTIFFPYLEAHNIKTIVHLGDMVDRRKYISFQTASRLWKDFTSKVLNYDFHLILGNHDITFKNTNTLNAAVELYRHANFKVYENATEVTLHGEKFLFIPWINSENREATNVLISSTIAEVVFGHLELAGFEMYKGITNIHGDDPSIFRKFFMVCSGHFHRRSSADNIHYLGSPCEFTWADFDDPKGFHVYDTETRELTFIPNPYTMFHKVFYDDLNKSQDEVLNVDFKELNGSYIKLIITNKTNPYWFDLFLSKLEKAEVSNIQIVEDHHNIHVVEDAAIVSEVESTIDIFKKHISTTTYDAAHKLALEKCIVSLYNEAISME